MAFCHGVFGQGRNWAGIAKALSSDAGPHHRSILIDMPNHGQSPWTERLSYESMAEEVADFLEPEGPIALVGHSMGGKVAMTIALTRPHQVERLCVADMSPVIYHGRRQFDDLIEALKSLDLAHLHTRQQADDEMAAMIPDPTVRAFLLQNLRRYQGGHHFPRWYWQPNLNLISENLRELASWHEPEGYQPYQGPVLWVGGANSDYIRPEYHDYMRELFPKVRLVTIKNAGHWVHSEQPTIFTSWLRHFLDTPFGQA